MIKILLRGRAEQVGLLIRHEFQRLGLPFLDGEIGVQMVTLVEGIRSMDTQVQDLAQKVIELCHEYESQINRGANFS